MRESIETPTTAQSPCALPPVAAAISAAVHSASVMPRPAQLGQRGPDLGGVVERQHPVADDLAALVPLACDQQDVARRQLGDGGADRLAAIADLERAGQPARIARRIAAGSSLRGLSSVTNTRSARAAAMRPISGRLPGSRSPPQPNSAIRRPAACGRSASRA